ncbi:hypothetical protein [Streptomyces hydrogenans]|uniref:hypothetical protein n=1 Tax=Streptomyces hydrogenans TaxID=1873719 RepID=UPI0036E82820
MLGSAPPSEPLVRVRPAPDTTFVETHWGRDGRTGPQYPTGTRICVEIRETDRTACVRLR